MRRSIDVRSCVLIPWVLGAIAADGRTADPRPARTDMVAMRDGVRLATDVYLPPDGSGPWPALLVRTPYSRTAYHREYGPWAGMGYAVVLQDMRGRFGSEGTDLAFLDCGWGERQDGVDTIDWIARQPWCDGKVGTIGASAMGITQNMLAAAAPKHLVAQYIQVAVNSLYHEAAYCGGALQLSLVAGWLFDNRFHPANLWLTVLHPVYDDHWHRVDATARAAQVRVPAVHLGGWYDVFLQGTIDAFVARQERGGRGARGTQKLIIGPWCHGGPGSDANPNRTGDVLFPPNARRLPYSLNGQTWFEHYLKGVDNGVDRAPAVHYYTMGAIDEPNAPGNAWHEDEAWPPESELTTFYLHADGALAMTKPAAANASRSFTFDPRDPVPTRGGGNLTIPAGVRDQREIEKRPDVLVFTSAPLHEPVEVTGRVVARLFIESDRPDTDFAVKLCDVYPDGRSLNVCDGILRVRHRKGFDRIDLLTSGEVTPIDVDLGSTSIVFNKGHRLRVHATSSNYPRADVNPNTGWPAWPFCPVETAHNTVHCSAGHASLIELPVVRR